MRGNLVDRYDKIFIIVYIYEQHRENLISFLPITHLLDRSIFFTII